MSRSKAHRNTSRLACFALIALAVLVAALPMPAAAQQAPAAGSKQVRLILQGSNGSQLAALVVERGGRVIRDLRIAGGLAVEVPASEVAALARANGVKRIVPDVRVVGHAKGDDELNGAGRLAVAYPWAVAAPPLWQGNKQGKGKNIGVALVDSGIASSSDFDRRIVATASFGAAGDGALDSFGHGTAVAGVIGGSGALSQGKYVGVAPEVNLISLKVGDENGVAYVSDVVAAIKWAVEHKNQYNIRVLNLSLTSSVPESYKTSLLSVAVQYAWFNGIVVVVAAGNCDPAGQGGRPCGQLYPPANDPYVITVGATDDHGTKPTSDDTLAVFSSFGVTGDGFAKPDLAAPGRHLTTVMSAPNSTLALADPSRVIDGRYIRLSGTSLSAGVVSGVAAQLLQSHPGYRPDQVKWLLARTTQAVGQGGGIAGTGAGYPQAQRAVAYGGGLGLANRGLVPNYYLALAVAKALGWNGVSWDGVSWDGVSWDGVSWDGVSWDGVSWDGVSWDGVSWDGVSWDGVSWDGVSWDGVSWD